MDFKDLCNFFDEIRNTKNPKEKNQLIRERFKKLRDKGYQSNMNFFQILRLILPQMDRERDSYHMKEAKISRTLIKLLMLPPGKDRNILSNPNLMSGQAADFGDVVYSVVTKYLSSNKTKVTVDDINIFLDNLTKRKSESEAEDLMMKMFEKMTPANIRWLIRIILKDLKLGISSNTILNCYHKDGASFYASNNNLRKVCETLMDQNTKLHELDIQIFEPFRPMLCKRIDAGNFKKAFPDNKMFYVENKFDGERFQLHMDGNNFQYFSRNGFDFTYNLGKSYDVGIFTPKLKLLFNQNVKKVILDGEMMLWDKRQSKFGSKGMTWDVKKLNDKGYFQPCYCIYDIILLNDRILTNAPLCERKAILGTIFEDTMEGVIMLSEVKEVQSRQELVDELNMAVEIGEEGIVVKDPDSIYKYSDRNSGWYKMKLEYFQNDVMNDLDLILMGGVHAKSTSDILNSFIVGIRSNTGDSHKPIYLSMGKVHSGLTDEEISMTDVRLKTLGKKFKDFNSETLLFGKEKPNYYIEPEHSLIFQIRATELIRSTESFKTPYTLRFPRILKIRDDKPVDECLTINELLELTKTNRSVIKLNKRKVELDEIIKTKGRRLKSELLTMPKYLENKQVSDLLEGYNIYVLSGSDSFEKENAESYIKRAGGTVSYRANEKVDIVLAGALCKEVKDLIHKRKTFDIINISWLKRTLEDGNLLGYDQDEVYYLGCNYKNCLADELDMYGDSYTEETTVEKLKRTFEIIKEMGVSSNQNGIIEIKRFRKNFAHYLAYFDKYSTVEDSESEIIYDAFLDEIEFIFYGGNVTDNIRNANLIIFNGLEARRNYLEQYLASRKIDNLLIKAKTFIYEQN